MNRWLGQMEKVKVIGQYFDEYEREMTWRL